MSEEFNVLSDLQRDTLQECFNIGIGRAARGLSHLLHAEVAMSTPILVMLSVGDAHTLVDPALQKTEACVVTRDINGIDAQAAMIFQGSRTVMASLLPTLLVADTEQQDRQADAATKMGYLVIESCVDQLEEIIGHPIARRGVVYADAIPKNLFQTGLPQDQGLVVVRVDLSLRKHNIAGHLLFAFTLEAANHLAAGLDRVLSESEG